MIIARITPAKSSAYKTLSKLSEKMDSFIKLKPYQWFAVWVLMSSGTSAQQGFENRFSYWDMSQTGIGFVLLAIVTGVMTFLVLKGIFSFDSIELNLGSLVPHFMVPLLLFMTGWGWQNGEYYFALKSFLPYFLAYLPFVFMYQINLDEVPNKGYQLGKGVIFFCLLMAITSFSLGINFDDPVISTASAVAAPFLLIALVFPQHQRHIQRLRIYPIFIYAMFVSVRVPWLLIPLAILFFGLRTYNYYRFNIVYPGFAVDHD